MNNYKHIELAILNGAMTEPLDFVIFTTKNHNVKPKTLSSMRTEAQRKSVLCEPVS
jgi:hypothetical protein